MKQVFKSLRRLPLLLVELYGLVTLIILLGQIIIGERWHVIGFLNSFAQLYWLPALFLLPLLMMRHSKRAALLVLPAALAWIITFGDHFIPKLPVNPSADDTTFTLMTYNLLDNGRDPFDIIAQITEIEPDIVVMQELTIQRADAIDATLSDMYPYRAFHTHRGFSRGLGVMSKYPITADRFWQYDFMPNSLGHQRVEIEIGDHTLTLYNLHPIHPGLTGEFFNPTMRGREIQAILEDASREAAPFMMAGDFNLPELSQDYHRITQEYGFVDAYREQGWGLGHTFTRGGNFPFLRIDYIFLGAGVGVTEIKVWPTGGGSDHRPVVGRFILRR